MPDQDPQQHMQTDDTLQRVQAYRQRHPEKVSEWNRDYYERNRDRLKQRRVLDGRDTENSSP